MFLNIIQTFELYQLLTHEIHIDEYHLQNLSKSIDRSYDYAP